MNGNTKEITWKINDGCHECTSHATNSSGYPQTRISGKLWAISRYIYTQHYGEIPKGKIIRHKCDNRLCINIDHLEIGTHKDNSQDMVKRNRSAKGVKNGNAKLTESDVLEIRQIGRSQPQIEVAKMYNVKPKAIRKILKRFRWKHI